MISITELRIGNQILDPDGNLIRVNSIDADYNYVNLEPDLMCSSIDGLNPDHCNPIQLSADILNRCNMFILKTTEGVDYVKLRDDLVLVVQKDHYILSYIQDSFPRLIDLQTRIKYVHELQNLYYVLTGQELLENHIAL